MKLQCDIQLPASKSESNRALMIAAYGGFATDFQNLSDSKDTLVLMNALSGIAALPLIDSKRTASSWNDIRGSAQRSINLSVHVIPCGGGGDGIYARMVDVLDCGTAARFMTTFLATHEGNWLLTGSERMQQRPMAPLVEALSELGAEIQYVGQPGFLPLQIDGKTICGGKISLDMSQSSQFASSLLLAAPMWPQGLELELFGQLNSLPYLDLTLSMMQHFGAKAQRKDRKIVVEPCPYQSRRFVVSADWSAASYWYEMAALSEDCEIRLHGLSKSSIQGDSVIQDWMKLFGVVTTEEDDAIVLRKEHFESRPEAFDFSSTPDLFPTMAAVCAGLQVEARFSGVANLGIKESNRIEAMKTELAKIGVGLNYISKNEVVLTPASQLPYFGSSSPLNLQAHGDHRIVMALAPLSLKLGYFTFDHPEVVGKSYPSFWNNVLLLKVLL
jgi:3-phosphoshikimate 1-carboxyvinyltransferase